MLGRGQLGVVVLLRSEGGDEVVSKQVRLDTLRGADLAQLENEVRLLSSMRHPHIVQYLTTFQDADALHILMEYARGGTLEQQIEQRAARGHRFASSLVRKWLRQLVSALEYMHGMRVLHRDLGATRNSAQFARSSAHFF